MALCQLFIQPEAAYLSVSELGETGTVQFRDVRDVFYSKEQGSRNFIEELNESGKNCYVNINESWREKKRQDCVYKIFNIYVLSNILTVLFYRI